MFPLGRSPCNLFRTSLDRSCSPSFLLVSPCVRCRPRPWYSAIRFQRRHRRRRRRMLPHSAVLWSSRWRWCGRRRWSKGEKPAREGEGAREGRRERGGRLGKVQRLRSPPLRADGGGAHCLARSLPRSLAAPLCWATRSGGGNQAD